MLTRPKIILQQSATKYQKLQFHIIINIVHCWDPTERNHVVNIYIYIFFLNTVLMPPCRL